jgi:hypothetical protein
LTKFVEKGGNLIATFETSLYDEKGKRRSDFGLAGLFGLSYGNKVEGPMKNSYLKLVPESKTGKFHPVLDGLEDAYRIINGVYRVETKPNIEFPSPLTLIPSYPDLPMEHVYPRQKETGIRELYLRELGPSRIAFIPWDIDRSFWQFLSADHAKLIRNIIQWTCHDTQPVQVTGPGLIDITAWSQKHSMTVHLVNLTNPMMMKGPFRELLPISEQKVQIQIPENKKIKGVRLLVNDKNPAYQIRDGMISLVVPSILDHEVVALDFET